MSTAVLLDYIDQHRGRFGVEPICTVLRKAGMQIAPSTYYAAKIRSPSARAVADRQRLQVIRRVLPTTTASTGSARCTPN